MSALWALLALAVGPAFGQTYMARPQVVSIKDLTVYYNIVGPLSSLPMTRRDLPKDAVDAGEVSGASCQNEINIPTSASMQATTITAAEGNGSYQRAMSRIHERYPLIAGIYDVKTDIHIFSIFFGVYHRVCTEVLARGYMLSQPPKK